VNDQEEATGQPLTDWTLESLSGFDYTQEVPEPGPLVLTLILVSRARCGDTDGGGKIRDSVAPISCQCRTVQKPNEGVSNGT
jgi:hypothetical protein